MVATRLRSLSPSRSNMHNFFAAHRQRIDWILLGVGILCIAASFGVLVGYGHNFGFKRDTAVMIGSVLPELKSSVALLRANTEAEQMFARDGLAAREEQAKAYVLTDGSPAPRTVAALQDIVAALAKRPDAKLSFDRLTFDAKPADLGSEKTLGATLVLKGNFRDTARVLGILSFSGDMMVRDTIGDADERAFLEKVESSAPLSLKAAEDFLYTDLLDYASDPDRAEQAFLADMATDTMGDIRSFILGAGLADVRLGLQDTAPLLKDKRAWPLPLLSVIGMHREGDTWTISLTIFSR